MKNEINLTEKEIKLLDNIALNDYTSANGGYPEDHWEADCWSDTLECGPHGNFTKNFGGVVTSLQKKGLLCSNGESVGHTRLGYQVWNERSELAAKEKAEHEAWKASQE